MFSRRFIVSYLMLIVCIYICVGSSLPEKCTVKDTQALLKLKDGFIDELDILSSWKGEDCCNWNGVSCNNLTGHVTRLDLESSHYPSLGGKIDSSICELQHLTSLNLALNDLEGEIPHCIGTLGELIELRLKFNELGGVIPHTLGNLSKLQILDIGYNYYLFANNLEWVSRLSNLRYLDLSVINLRRALDWLSSISQIPSLSNLYLDDCGIHQVNPKFIVHKNFSNSLKILSLSGNNLSSSIPSWVLNASKVLTHLDLSYNSLQQSIPDGFAKLISLQYLDLSNNELDGGIPKSFKKICQLKELKLQSNKLSGRLSDCIQQLCSTQTLDLSSNPFKSGPLPDFSWLSSLKTLSLRNTSIVGPLPQSFGHLPNLAILDLSFNQLSGSLPPFEVSKIASLENLDLSHNQLNGTLPYAIGQLSSLRRLTLSSNKLNGIVSEVHLSNLSRLQILNVAQNSLLFNLSSNWVPPFQLIGLHASSCILGPKFPTWLKHLRELEYLQMSNSSILDTFPKWFWDLSSQLSYLNVSHNKLSGALPKT
ncbi:receptor-like protein EIX1, partial [Abrus precatorius]|uniref:Receptor-like protein EIX1 n=1 Tax=Abrus precatorius TaxID=3816 RepID=A0A8B8KAM2_ABRPR